MTDLEEMMEYLIPSRDVREYLEKTGREFTDFEKAALYYNRVLPFEKKQRGLRALMETTDDKKLKIQLAERIAYDDECLRIFTQKSEGYIYVLISLEERNEPETCGYFSDAELAASYGKRLGYSFHVEKHKIISPGNSENWEEDERAEQLERYGRSTGYKLVATLYFNEQGELAGYFSCENEQNPLYEADYDYSRFEYGYVYIPDLFERGDLVRYIEEDMVGIVASEARPPKDVSQFCREADYPVVKVNVNFPTDDGSIFWHAHLNPILLEKCGLPGNEWDKWLLELKEIMSRGLWAEYRVLEEGKRTS